jgi:multiple sugar transport system substrate-binding protein
VFPRTIVSVAALTLLAASVTACGGSSGKSAGSSPKTLTYWASNQGTSLANDQQVLAPELAKFTKQTGIKVNLQVIGWPDLLNKITAAATSGHGPDVLNIGNTWSASLQATGALLPFDDSTLAQIGGKSRFLGPSLAATGAVGKPPTAVPLYSKAYGLYYNTKMFAAAGISGPPTTWDQLVADGKKLTHGKQWGLALEAGDPTENAHHAFILGEQQGATLFDSSGKPHLDSDQEVAAVKQYVDFMAVDKIVNPSDAENSNGTQAEAEFAAGKAGMLLWQDVGNTFVADGMKASDYALAPIPLPATPPAGSKHVTSFVAGINLAVFKNTSNKAGALKFVQFMTSTPEQELLNKTYGSLPVVSDAYSDPSFQTPEMKTFQQILSTSAAPLPEVPQESQFETLVGTSMKNIFATAASGGNVTDSSIKSQLSQDDQQLQAGG